MDFISVKDKPPCENVRYGYPSEPMLVSVYEFNTPRTYAIACCVKLKTETGDHLVWCLDNDFYHIEGPYTIGSEVTHYCPLPKHPEDGKLEL